MNFLDKTMHFEDKIRSVPLKIFINSIRLWLKLRYNIGHIGKNSFIMPPFTRLINANRFDIGNNVRIGKHAFLLATKKYNNKIYTPKLIIGNNVSIGVNAIISVQNKITIQDNVLIAQRVLITDCHHRYDDINTPVLHQDLTDGLPIIIERDSYIGTNAVILSGVTIGQHSVVGANAVVTKDVPPFTVVAGAPAKIIKKYSWEEKIWIRV